MAISVTFWKLGSNVSPEDAAKITSNLMEKGLFPPEGTEILGWYICPGGRGVTISQSKGVEPGEAFKNWLMWIEERKDFFECYEVMPAVSAEDALKMVLAK